MSYNSKYKGKEVEDILDSVGGKQEKLVSGTNIKTINGTSILGSGNITISGGSGSGGGSGVYPEVHHGTSDRVFTLPPNTFHVWDEIYSLNLKFGDPIEGVVNEYIFQFSVPNTTDFHLTLSGGVLWPLGNSPIIEPQSTYVVSIVNNLGVYTRWPKPISGTDPA